ncbi:hypothetical protein RND71_044160 [Anisodus tanguticus]|uniref:Peptidase S1 domain-containing protein n=1 Tax=Anisodus tanguticus TaxID=243964 RepID=A0AAE1QS59_9SOLA|nr:hypothetical protein RND71_044160 [Anisodus tanguticus]
MASLGSKDNNHLCGATILNNHYVLTAAHCTMGKNPEDFTVRVGIQSIMELYEDKVYNVKNLIHRELKNPGDFGDFSLIEVDRPIQFEDGRVEPGCLNLKDNYFSDELLSAGWGLTSRPWDDLSGNNEKTNYNPYDTYDLKYYFSTQTEKDCKPHDICVIAKNEGDSACSGDSGGPLMHTKNGKTSVVGMAGFVKSIKEDYTVDLLIKHRKEGYKFLKQILLEKYSKEQGIIEEKILMKPFEDEDSFDYCDPSLEICSSDIKLRNLDTFTKKHIDAVASTDPERNLGEIVIYIPSQLSHYVAEGKLLSFNIEFGLEKPGGALVEAIVETLTPVVSAVLARSGFNQISSESLSPETKLILDEITRYFNMEKLLPCYHYTVTVSCLKAFRHLQKMGHLPNNSKFFQQYTQYGLFKEIRITAVEALVDIIKVEQTKEDFLFLLNLVEFDPVPSFKYNIIRLMTENPPISNKDANSPLNIEVIVDKIWSLMNIVLVYDNRLRNACIDMYYAFYGRQRPSCVPKPEFSVVLNLKEQTALVNHNLQEENDLELNSSSFTDNKEKDVNLSFDSGPSKRKHDDTELDEFDEKFNKEKRFKILENENYNNQEPLTDFDKINQSFPLPGSNTFSFRQDSIEQDSKSHHSDNFENSKDFTSFNKSSLAQNEPSTSLISFDNSVQLLATKFNLTNDSERNLNEETSDLQFNPNLISSDNPEHSLTFTMNKNIPGFASNENSKERVKEKKNKNKDKEKDKDKKKKKHKKHKKHKHKKDKEKTKDQSLDLINTNSSSITNPLIQTESQLVMSDADSSNPSAPNTP